MSTTKTARKTPKRRIAKPRKDSRQKMRELKVRWDRMMCECPLPFKIVRSCALPPTVAYDAAERDGFFWSEEALRVADATLRSGFHLLVEVSPTAVAFAMATFARTLPGNLFGGYNQESELLVLWYMLEDDSESLEKQD